MRIHAQAFVAIAGRALRAARWLVALTVIAGGCRHAQYIPNTKVVDTPLNREIVAVVEQYRRAMEERDAARVLTLADPTYSDQSGTPEADDDLDFASLKRVLPQRLHRCERVRYRLEYQRVEVRGRAATVDVWIDATFVYQQSREAPSFRRFTDYHRYQLLETDRRWRFVSGL